MNRFIIIIFIFFSFTFPSIQLNFHSTKPVALQLYIGICLEIEILKKNRLNTGDNQS